MEDERGEQLVYEGRNWRATRVSFGKRLEMKFGYEGLPKSEGKDAIIVIVDRFTKYSHFVALTHPFIAESIAKIFIDIVYKFHGMPTNIDSGMDKIFTSIFWREFFKIVGVHNCISLLHITHNQMGRLKG